MMKEFNLHLAFLSLGVGGHISHGVLRPEEKVRASQGERVHFFCEIKGLEVKCNQIKYSLLTLVYIIPSPPSKLIFLFISYIKASFTYNKINIL